MSKALNKYIKALYYAYRNLLVFSEVRRGVSLLVTGAPAGIGSASIRLVFFVSQRIAKIQCQRNTKK